MAADERNFFCEEKGKEKKEENKGQIAEHFSHSENKQKVSSHHSLCPQDLGKVQKEDEKRFLDELLPRIVPVTQQAFPRNTFRNGREESFISNRKNSDEVIFILKDSLETND